LWITLLLSKAPSYEKMVPEKIRGRRKEGDAIPFKSANMLKMGFYMI